MPCSRLFRILLVLASSSVVFLVLHLCGWTLVPSTHLMVRGNISSSAHRTPVILSWTTFFGETKYMLPDLRAMGCPVWNCNVTVDKAELPEASAVLFHLRDVDVGRLPPYKPGGQRWVLINYESPGNIPMNGLFRLQDKVDWTVSYRQDSDMISPYGLVRPRRHSDPPPMDITLEDFRRKSPVAWWVSNCKSRSNREGLAKELVHHLRVDVFGDCAKVYGDFDGLTIPEESSTRQGYYYLAPKYKFYLSFENSLCTDYATEKVFFPLLVGMVPVVLGRANYNKILPPKSFVNSASFSSSKSLAQHLTKLANNFTLYREYHKWRRQYVVQHVELQNNFVCDVCSRLHANQSAAKKHDLDLWWDASRDCLAVCSFFGTYCPASESNRYLMLLTILVFTCVTVVTGYLIGLKRFLNHRKSYGALSHDESCVKT